MIKPRPKRDEDTNLPYCDPRNCSRMKDGPDHFMYCQENEWTRSVIRCGQLCIPQLELDQKRLMELENNND